MQLTQNFIKQYEYNTQLAITRHDLETTKKNSSKNFSDYIAQWREKANLIRDRPFEYEQIEMP